MRTANARKLIGALFFSVLSLLALGTLHAGSIDRFTPGMGSMGHHDMSAIECHIHCVAAITPKDANPLSSDRQDKDPTPYIPHATQIVLSLLAVSFVVKYLYLLASWRPPDMVLLCGRYADGL